MRHLDGRFDFSPAAVGGGDVLGRPGAAVENQVPGLSDTARTVPSHDTVSGITLKAVPAEILVTVSTAGSNAGIRRVTIAWRAVTISQATGTGSMAS